jgi:hypothetical protein
LEEVKPDLWGRSLSPAPPQLVILGSEVRVCWVAVVRIRLERLSKVLPAFVLVQLWLQAALWQASGPPHQSPNVV